MVFEQVTTPPAPCAVSTYVFVADGDTMTEPTSGTVPMPSLSETFVAFVVVHESVDD